MLCDGVVHLICVGVTFSRFSGSTLTLSFRILPISSAHEPALKHKTTQQRNRQKKPEMHIRGNRSALQQCICFKHPMKRNETKRSEAKRNDDDDSRGSFLFAPGLRVASEADAIRSLRAVLLRKVPVQPPPSSSPPNPIDQST